MLLVDSLHQLPSTSMAVARSPITNWIDALTTISLESTSGMQSNTVIFYCPAGWKLAKNVRYISDILPSQRLQEDSIVMFGSGQPKDAFGPYPELVHICRIATLP